MRHSEPSRHPRPTSCQAPSLVASPRPDAVLSRLLPAERAGLGIDLAQITSISFTIRGSSDDFFDELRIGSSHGSVIAEPGAAWLLLLGLGGLAGSRLNPYLPVVA
jgi:hypothetical protein